MSFSIENLLNDAIKLSMNLKECETESNDLIFAAEIINLHNKDIKNFTEEMNALGNVSVKQPRSSLIASIQCESKKLKQLEAENSELKTTLQDYELVMELMSKKYRNHISKLISHLGVESKLIENNPVNLKNLQKIEEQTQKIENLESFIHKIINLDVKNFLDIQKSLTQLQLENEGLRHILGICKENNNFKATPVLVENGTQTEQTENSNDVLSNSKEDLTVDFSNDLNETKKLNEFSDDESNSSTIKKIVKEFKEDHSKIPPTLTKVSSKF